MAVRFIPPANQLGGDIYDFYRFDNNRLGILVADASGHGVNSAMLSGMVKALAAPLSMAVIEPGELLAGLDVAGEQFFPEGYFCTGFYLQSSYEDTGADPLRRSGPSASDCRRTERSAHPPVEPRHAGHRHGRWHGW